MTPDQIKLVQDSFAKVVPISEKASALFYQRLFEIAPEVRPLFNTAMPDQGRKLMSMLNELVRNLNNLESMIPTAEALAVRHVCYGVVPKYYESVGQSLIWTLEQGLGDDFTPATREAWLHVYQVLSGVMIRAAEEFEARGVGSLSPIPN